MMNLDGKQRHLLTAFETIWAQPNIIDSQTISSLQPRLGGHRLRGLGLLPLKQSIYCPALLKMM